jgi:chromosome partitioning protein
MSSASGTLQLTYNRLGLHPRTAYPDGSLQAGKYAFMHVIALLSQKGGGGRTTLAVSLATAAEETGLETLIIDLDPQATACKWGDRRTTEAPIVLDAQPARLANALAKAKEGGIKLALIDTPPRSAEAALAAAKLADLIVMPIRAQMYDLETIPNTLELIATASAGRSGPIPTVAVLNAVAARGNRHEQARDGLTGMGLAVCAAAIGHRAAFGDAAALGLSVLEHDKTGRAAEEVRQVFHELSRLLQQTPVHKAPPPAKPRRQATRDA